MKYSKYFIKKTFKQCNLIFENRHYLREKKIQKDLKYLKISFTHLLLSESCFLNIF